MILVFNVILQDRLSKLSSNIISKSLLKLVIILSSLVAKDTGNIMVLVCHVISQDPVIEGSCDFMGRSPSR